MKKLQVVISILFIFAGLLGYAREGMAAGEAWSTKTNMTTARYALAAAAAGSKVYAVGGYNGGYLSTLEEYDPSTNAWTSKASLVWGRAYFAAAAVGGKVYAIGGQGAGSYNKVEAYDSGTNTWATVADLNSGRAHTAAAVAGGKIYSIGGQNLGGGVVGTVEEYDPALNTWTTKAPMPTSRYHAAAAAVNGKVYVMGGMISAGTVTNIVEEYTPAAGAGAGTWVTKAVMPTAREYLTAAAINGKVYAIGGSTGGTYFNKTEEYTPGTNTWVAAANMSTARNQLASAVVNEKIYAVGGVDSSGGPIKKNEQFGAIAYIDIGLRIYDGTSTITVAAEPDTEVTSALRIGKNNKAYGIGLVPVGDPLASKMMIRTSGGTKAIRKFSAGGGGGSAPTEIAPEVDYFHAYWDEDGYSTFDGDIDGRDELVAWHMRCSHGLEADSVTSLKFKIPAGTDLSKLTLKLYGLHMTPELEVIVLGDVAPHHSAGVPASWRLSAGFGYTDITIVNWASDQYTGWKVNDYNTITFTSTPTVDVNGYLTISVTAVNLVAGTGVVNAGFVFGSSQSAHPPLLVIGQ